MISSLANVENSKQYLFNVQSSKKGISLLIKLKLKYNQGCYHIAYFDHLSNYWLNHRNVAFDE